MELKQAPEGIDCLEENLLNDGFKRDSIGKLLDCSRHRLASTMPSFDKYVTEIPYWNIQKLLCELGSLFLFMQDLSQDQFCALRDVIGSAITRSLREPREHFAFVGNMKNLMRFRAILPQFIDMENFADALDQFLSSNDVEEVRVIDMYGEVSIYGAMYYSELRALFPTRDGLFTKIRKLIDSRHRRVSLFAHTSPREGGTSLEFGKDVTEDGDIRVIEGVYSTRRCDSQVGTCPEAETSHLRASLMPSNSYSGNNTFVFKDGLLLGSLKHRKNDIHFQESFLAMRTVASKSSISADDTTYPLIAGGLYIVADKAQLNNIVLSGKRYDVHGTIGLMPVRETLGIKDGFLHCTRLEYLQKIHNVRRIIESGNDNVYIPQSRTH